MGIFDAAGGVISANRAKKAAAQTKKDAQKNRQQGLDYVAGLNWEPELLSDHAPTYQRSQSPVADAFLMSLLTGQNPAAVQGTRQGAPQLKAAAQRGFDRSTGGLDALRQRQRAMESETPWAPKPFSGPAVTEEDKWKTQAPGLNRGGITREHDATLRSAGVELDPVSARNSGKLTVAMGGGIFGDNNAWGVKTDPAFYKRYAEAVQSGDMELADRIMRGMA